MLCVSAVIEVFWVCRFVPLEEQTNATRETEPSVTGPVADQDLLQTSCKARRNMLKFQYWETPLLSQHGLSFSYFQVPVSSFPTKTIFRRKELSLSSNYVRGKQWERGDDRRWSSPRSHRLPLTSPRKDKCPLCLVSCERILPQKQFFAIHNFTLQWMLRFILVLLDTLLPQQLYLKSLMNFKL